MSEQEWFEQIYQEYADYLFRLGRHLLGASQGDGELYDLMQDAFMDAWSKRSTLMTHPNIGGWLSLSIKNRAASYQQKRARRGKYAAFSLDEEDARPAASSALTPEREAVVKDRVAAITELLGQENAELFFAYVLEGSSAKELGRRHGLSEDCVWVRISRMKKKLAVHPEIFYAMLLMTLGLV